MCLPVNPPILLLLILRLLLPLLLPRGDGSAVRRGLQHEEVQGGEQLHCVVREDLATCAKPVTVMSSRIERVKCDELPRQARAKRKGGNAAVFSHRIGSEWSPRFAR